jgi:hypothetical protein
MLVFSIGFCEHRYTDHVYEDTEPSVAGVSELVDMLATRDFSLQITGQRTKILRSYIYIYKAKAVPEGSSPISQESATGPYPEPTGSTLHPQPISLRSILILPYHVCLDLPSGLFPSGFPTKTLYTFFSSPVRATCPAHLIHLDLICLMISGDEYKI